MCLYYIFLFSSTKGASRPFYSISLVQCFASVTTVLHLGKIVRACAANARAPVGSDAAGKLLPSGLKNLRCVFLSPHAKARAPFSAPFASPHPVHSRRAGHRRAAGLRQLLHRQVCPR